MMDAESGNAGGCLSILIENVPKNNVGTEKSREKALGVIDTSAPGYRIVNVVNLIGLRST
jgi:hypothetical protein